MRCSIQTGTTGRSRWCCRWWQWSASSCRFFLFYTNGQAYNHLAQPDGLLASQLAGWLVFWQMLLSLSLLFIKTRSPASKLGTIALCDTQSIAKETEIEDPEELQSSEQPSVSQANKHPNHHRPTAKQQLDWMTIAKEVEQKKSTPNSETYHTFTTTLLQEQVVAAAFISDKINSADGIKLAGK